MRRRLMVIQSAEPVSHTAVRFPELAALEVTKTDAQGFLEAELPESGLLSAEIYRDGSWQRRTIELPAGKPLVIVDMTRPGLSTPLSNQLGASRLLGERYRFESVLGRGGMGIVIKAHDRLLDRDVAVKMLNEEFRDNEEAQRLFLSEARNLSTLSHQNLVAVHDITTIEGRALIVLEHIEGQPLDRLLRQHGPCTETTTLRVGIQLSRALAYLHQHGILHRDIKPGNLLLLPDGEVKLIDFGLSRSLEDLYNRGTRVRGTPAYMAPEQILGQPLGPATDIYQLGASLYEMLTAELPFPEGDPSYAHLHREPPPLRERLPDLRAPQLADLIHHCLAKDPAQRPGARQLHEALQELYLQSGPHAPRPDSMGPISDNLLLTDDRITPHTNLTSPPLLRSAPPSATPDRPRSLPPYLLAAVALLALAIGGLFSALAAQHLREDNPPPTQARAAIARPATTSEPSNPVAPLPGQLADAATTSEVSAKLKASLARQARTAATLRALALSRTAIATAKLGTPEPKARRRRPARRRRASSPTSSEAISRGEKTPHDNPGVKEAITQTEDAKPRAASNAETIVKKPRVARNPKARKRRADRSKTDEARTKEPRTREPRTRRVIRKVKRIKKVRKPPSPGSGDENKPAVVPHSF